MIFFHASHFTRRSSRARVRAFTLVELLVVIAIIGALAGILIPTMSASRNSAKRAETKVRFSQWAIAMEQFRQEYGYYPQVDGGGTANKVNPTRFAGALTARTLSGTAYTVTTDTNLGGNKKLIAFYSIGESELSSARTALVDGYGNTDIAVIYDTNGDGLLNATDGTAVTVTSTDTGNTLTPASTDLSLTTGVRAGVIFYSAGKGTAASDIIYSWK
jgi:prepilin-type N-terminal cleavage/methylation domain-containing protein